MFNFQTIIILNILLFLANGVLISQTAADVKLLQQLDKELILDSLQKDALKNKFKSYSQDLDSLNKEIKAIQTSTLSEDSINLLTSVLFRERKDLNNQRKENIIAELTVEQAKTYKEKFTLTTKPVLHFGHQKSTCVVCVIPK